MKKILTILTNVVLGSNTGLLLTRPTNQVQKLDGIVGNPIFVQTMTKNPKLLEDNSKQLTAELIHSIITLINNTLVLKNMEINVESIEGSEDSAKSQIKSKFIEYMETIIDDNIHHFNFDFNFTESGSMNHIENLILLN